MFTSIMMDQGAFWRSRETVDVNGVTFAGGAAAIRAVQEVEDGGPSGLQRDGAPAHTAAAGARGSPASTAARSLPAKQTSAAPTSPTISGSRGPARLSIRPDLLAGIAFGGSSSNFSVRDRITSGHLEGAHFGGYGVKTWGWLYAAGALSFSTFRNDTTAQHRRHRPAETATGDFGSNLLSGRVEVAQSRSTAGSRSRRLRPCRFLAWQNGFNRTNPLPAGAVDPLGLSFGSRSVTSLPTFWVRSSIPAFVFRNGMALSPYARLSWVHEFNPDRAINPTFIALPDAAFTATARARKRCRAH